MTRQGSHPPVQREATPQQSLDTPTGMGPHFDAWKVPLFPPDSGPSAPMEGQGKLPKRERLEAFPRTNRPDLPGRLKDGLEGLSGISMASVRVTYNSSKPAQLGALAYTQGSQIHVAPGQERHLPHEGWHAVQQLQGRVNSRVQLKGQGLNDDEALEHEADVMGARAASWSGGPTMNLDPGQPLASAPIQREVPEGGLPGNFPVIVISSKQNGVVTAWHQNDRTYTVWFADTHTAMSYYANQLDPTAEGQILLNEQESLFELFKDKKSQSDKNLDQKSASLPKFEDSGSEKLISPYSAKKPQQMKKFVAKTKHGTWTVHVDPVINKEEYGVHAHVDFEVNEQQNNDRQILLIQAVKRMRKGSNDVHIQKFAAPMDSIISVGTGKVIHLDETKMMPHGTQNGIYTFVDQYHKNESPIYDSKDKKQNGLYGTTLDKYAKTEKNRASLWDRPSMQIEPAYPNVQENPQTIDNDKFELLKRSSSMKSLKNVQEMWGESGQTLETAALLINKDGTFAYLGSIKWGWQLNDDKDWAPLDPEVLSEDNPSELFLSAAKAWNMDDTRTKIPMPEDMQKQ